MSILISTSIRLFIFLSLCLRLASHRSSCRLSSLLVPAYFVLYCLLLSCFLPLWCLQFNLAPPLPLLPRPNTPQPPRPTTTPQHCPQHCKQTLTLSASRMRTPFKKTLKRKMLPRSWASLILSLSVAHLFSLTTSTSAHPRTPSENTDKSASLMELVPKHLYHATCHVTHSKQRRTRISIWNKFLQVSCKYCGQHSWHQKGNLVCPKSMNRVAKLADDLRLFHCVIALQGFVSWLHCVFSARRKPS